MEEAYVNRHGLKEILIINLALLISTMAGFNYLQVETVLNRFAFNKLQKGRFAAKPMSH